MEKVREITFTARIETNKRTEVVECESLPELIEWYNMQAEQFGFRKYHLDEE